jgi:hypothetical protein
MHRSCQAAVLAGCLFLAGLSAPGPRAGAAAPAARTCTVSERALENLRVAAQAKLPVPATQITYRALPAPTVTRFAAQTGAAPEPGAIRRQERAGARWTFVVRRDLVVLDVRPQSARARAWLTYQFPRGRLSVSPGLAQLAGQLKESLERLQVSGQQVEVATPAHTGYLAADGVMLAPDFLQRISGQAWAQECTAWSLQQVDAYRGGRITSDAAAVLNLGNGTRVGFAPGRVVWVGAKSGVTTVTWYAIPGIRP